MSKHLSKSILSGLALAGLAGAFLSTAAPAEARPNACHKRYQACESRCARANADFVSCIYRTCNPQYDNCEGIGRGGRAGLAGANRSNVSPRTTNPLPPGGMKPKQAGGIVTGGVRPNGGGMRPFASGRR